MAIFSAFGSHQNGHAAPGAAAGERQRSDVRPLSRSRAQRRARGPLGGGSDVAPALVEGLAILASGHRSSGLEPLGLAMSLVVPLRRCSGAPFAEHLAATIGKLDPETLLPPDGRELAEREGFEFFTRPPLPFLWGFSWIPEPSFAPPLPPEATVDDCWTIPVSDAGRGANGEPMLAPAARWPRRM